jgi:hypothetical protein
MRSWGNTALESGAAHPLRFGAHGPLARPGLLHLVTAHDVAELRLALAKGALPPDFEAKLANLAGGSIVQRFIEQNSRLFFALLLAAEDGSFTEATPAQRDRLLRVLAYVRKDEDAIPDYKLGGFADDHQEVRAAATELAPLLSAFKVWRLRHQVPGMWRAA